MAMLVQRHQILQLLDGGKVGAHSRGSTLFRSLCHIQICLRLVNMGHGELALADCEGHPALYQFQRIAPEYLVAPALRSEEHTSELQSLMRSSYAVLCLNKKNRTNTLSRVT